MAENNPAATALLKYSRAQTYRDFDNVSAADYLDRLAMPDRFIPASLDVDGIAVDIEYAQDVPDHVVRGQRLVELSRRFAELPAGRFDGLGYTRAESGVVMLDDALAQLECRCVARHDAGDHTIIVGEVEWAEVQSGRPLLYYRGGYAQLER